MTTDLPSLDTWVLFLDKHELPILHKSERALAKARAEIDFVKDREIINIIHADPMLMVRVLRFMAESLARSKARQTEPFSPTSVANVVQALGLNPFFRHFSKPALVEDKLKGHPKALVHALHRFRCAQRASEYAFNWAVWRYEPGHEEVSITALLYELPELLAWCFSPQRAQKMHELAHANPKLPPEAIERSVFGFPLHDLQLKLCEIWTLPPLLKQACMDEDIDRVKTVRMASRLARLSAQGWTHPELDPLLSDIARHLGIPRTSLLMRLGIEVKDEHA